MSLEPDAKRARIATDYVESNMDDDVSEMVAGVLSDDPSSQLESTIKLRKFLTLDMTTSTENVIKSEVVTRLVEFLKKEDSPKLQLEAACAVTNLAADKPEVVVEHGVVPILVRLIASPNDDIPQQAIWALCNVSGGSAPTRNHVLSCKVLSPLLHLLNVNTKLSMLRLATGTLVNLCFGNPPPPFDQVKRALPKLERLLRSNDEEVASNASTALWLMSRGSGDGMQSVIEAGFVPVLVQHLQHTCPSVRLRMFGTICCILSKYNQQVQRVIDCGVLPILANVLNQDCGNDIKMYTCRMITNITSGTEKQIQSVIEANLIPTMVNLAQDSEMNIKRNALWAILKATLCGSHDQVRYLVVQNCIKPLCDSLVSPDPCIIFVCLNGLEKILKVGEAEKNKGDHVNYYHQGIYDAEGHEKIKNLQSHDHNKIKEKAVKILETYWRF